jgi:hypothetical protein
MNSSHACCSALCPGAGVLGSVRLAIRWSSAPGVRKTFSGLQQQGRANSYSTLEAEDTAAASVCLSTSLPRSTRAFSTRSRV